MNKSLGRVLAFVGLFALIGMQCGGSYADALSFAPSSPSQDTPAWRVIRMIATAVAAIALAYTLQKRKRK